jgi:lipopolysaccharide/colanic/teichoic acid biosynthesis glycosyltransferase
MLAILVAVAAAPIALVIALAVRLGVGAPILFRQVRAGRDGKDFEIVKFRTMRDLWDEQGSLLPDSSRVTRVGRLLRRTRLDEIPEILNILRGEMSFVGPRPLLPSTISKFGADGVLRCQVRPGLTGWAQINGNTLLTQQEKLELDLWYVTHRSPAMDAWVMLRTVAVMVFGERRNTGNLEKALASDRNRRC